MKLTSKNEAEYFALRDQGLTHDQAMTALGEPVLDRNEWTPENVTPTIVEVTA